MCLPDGHYPEPGSASIGAAAVLRRKNLLHRFGISLVQSGSARHLRIVIFRDEGGEPGQIVLNRNQRLTALNMREKGIEDVAELVHKIGNVRVEIAVICCNDG